MPSFEVPQGKDRAKALKRVAERQGQSQATALEQDWKRLEKLPCPICGEPIGGQVYVLAKVETLAGLGVTKFEQAPDPSLLIHAMCFYELSEKAG